MPVLRFRDDNGRPAEQLIERTSGADGLTPPLTIGRGPASPTHIAVPGATVCARIVGSSVTTWYAYIVAGDGVLVNGEPLEAIRVLRHGDRVDLGGVRVLYLDFTIRTLSPESRLVGSRCTLKNCQRTAFAPGATIASCPWCGKSYHAGCWLEQVKCAGEGDCYPVRRVLMAELSGRIRPDKMPRLPNEVARLCSARCGAVDEQGIVRPAPPLNPGDDILRCPNEDCYRAYHPQCWLSFRAPCYCGFDVPGLISRVVERADLAEQL